MKLLRKSETFILPSPLAEPEITWSDREYAIERLTKEDGSVIWFGYGTNWVKEPGEEWTKLADRGQFIECDEPIYEKLYQEFINKKTGK